jgi:F0F1-type ATP synthase membrane subunit b/b'
MDEATTAGDTPMVSQQDTPEEIREHIESSLEEANGTVAPLTGLEEDGQGSEAPVGQAQQKVEDAMGQAQEKLGDAMGQAQEKLEGVKGQAQEKLEGVKGQAQEKLDGVKEQAKAKVTSAHESASGKSDDLLGKAKAVSPQSVAQQAWEVGRGNPVPLAVGGAFLAGMVLGRRGRR